MELSVCNKNSTINKIYSAVNHLLLSSFYTQSNQSGFSELPLELHYMIAIYLGIDSIKKVSKLSPELRRRFGPISWRYVVVHCYDIPDAQLLAEMGIQRSSARYINFDVFYHPEKYSWFRNENVVHLQFGNLVSCIDHSLDLTKAFNLYPKLKNVRCDLAPPINLKNRPSLDELFHNFAFANYDRYGQLDEQLNMIHLTSNELARYNMDLILRKEWQFNFIKNTELVSRMDIHIEWMFGPFYQQLKHFVNLTRLTFNPEFSLDPDDYDEFMKSTCELKKLEWLKCCYQVDIHGQNYSSIEYAPSVNHFEVSILINTRLCMMPYFYVSEQPGSLVMLPPLTAPQVTAVSIVAETREKLVSHPPILFKRLNFPNAKHLEISGIYLLRDDTEFFFKHAENLTSLSIQIAGSCVRAFLLPLLRRLPNVEELSVYDISTYYQQQVEPENSILPIPKDKFEPYNDLFASVCKGEIVIDENATFMTYYEKIWKQIQSRFGGKPGWDCMRIRDAFNILANYSLYTGALCNRIGRMDTHHRYEYSMDILGLRNSKNIGWFYSYYESIFAKLMALPKLKTVRVVGVPRCFESPQFQNLITTHETLQHVYVTEMHQRDPSDQEHIWYSDHVSTVLTPCVLIHRHVPKIYNFVKEFDVDVEGLRKGFCNTQSTRSIFRNQGDSIENNFETAPTYISSPKSFEMRFAHHNFQY